MTAHQNGQVPSCVIEVGPENGRFVRCTVTERWQPALRRVISCGNRRIIKVTRRLGISEEHKHLLDHHVESEIGAVNFAKFKAKIGSTFSTAVRFDASVEEAEEFEISAGECDQKEVTIYQQVRTFSFDVIARKWYFFRHECSFDLDEYTNVLYDVTNITRNHPDCACGGDPKTSDYFVGLLLTGHLVAIVGVDIRESVHYITEFAELHSPAYAIGDSIFLPQHLILKRWSFLAQESLVEDGYNIISKYDHIEQIPSLQPGLARNCTYIAARSFDELERSAHIERILPTAVAARSPALPSMHAASRTETFFSRLLNQLNQISEYRTQFGVFMSLIAVVFAYERISNLVSFLASIFAPFFKPISYLVPQFRLSRDSHLIERDNFSISGILFPLSLVLSLGFPAFFSMLARTFVPGHEISQIDVYFVQDYPRVLTYAIIAPTYLTLSMIIIITSLRRWAFYRDTKSHIPETVNILCIVLFVLFMPVFICVNYFKALIDTALPIYWFTEVTTHGDKTINEAGIAMISVETIKLMILAMAGLFFFGSAKEIFRLASVIQHNDTVQSMNEWRGRLRHYCIIELSMKFIIFAMTMDLFIFDRSQVVQRANVATQMILLLFSVAIVPLPRVYFEYKRFTRGYGLTDLRHQDLRFASLIEWWCHIVLVFAASLYGNEASIVSRQLYQHLTHLMAW